MMIIDDHVAEGHGAEDDDGAEDNDGEEDDVGDDDDDDDDNSCSPCKTVANLLG